MRQNNEFYHFGIPGQQWGVRRFQNKDGSLTAQGEERYKKGDFSRSVSNLRKEIAEVKRSNAEEKLNMRYRRRTRKWIGVHSAKGLVSIALAERKLINALAKYGEDYNVVYDSENDRYRVLPK